MNPASFDSGRIQVFILLFTAAYLALFGAWFLYEGNDEYLWYVGLIYIFGGLAWYHLRDAQLPNSLLLALSFAGFLHMAGRSVWVGDDILYNVVIGDFVLADNTQAVLFKYDQFLHAYGYGVAALLIRFITIRFAPGIPAAGAVAIAILAAMGIGAANEIVEFAAATGFETTYVGDYYNTSLDLVANAFGAIVAIAGAEWYERIKRIA